MSVACGSTTPGPDYSTSGAHAPDLAGRLLVSGAFRCGANADAPAIAITPHSRQSACAAGLPDSACRSPFRRGCARRCDRGATEDRAGAERRRCARCGAHRCDTRAGGDAGADRRSRRHEHGRGGWRAVLRRTERRRDRAGLSQARLAGSVSRPRAAARSRLPAQAGRSEHLCARLAGAAIRRGG